MSMVRELMSENVEVVHEDANVCDIARTLASSDVGAVPVCGADDRLKGMVTDRDLVVKVLAENRDPQSITAAELGDGDSRTVTIGADDSLEDAARTMIDKQVRRLPVIDGDRVIGMLSLGDLSRHREELAGDIYEQLVTAPANN